MLDTYKSKNSYKKNVFKKSLIALVISTLINPVYVSQSFASENEEEVKSEDKTLEVISVTATRRDKSIQETAISISAFGGDELEQKGYSSISEFVDTVPGITSVPGSAGGASLTIRNIATAVEIGGASFTATYLDDSVISTNSLRLVDVERVEVLKGPQGTLYGRSAMSGIVRYISNKPNTDYFEGGFNFSYGNVTDGGNDYNGYGYVNIPITDNLAVRAVGYKFLDAGFIDNLELGKNDINEAETKGGRIAIHWDATDTFSVDVMYLKQDSSSTPSNVTTTREPGSLSLVGDEGPDIPFNLNDRTRISGLHSLIESEFEVTNFKIENDFDSFTASLIATSLQSTASTQRDIREFIGNRAGCLCDNINPSNGNTETLELRLVSTDNKSKVDWILGAYYENGDFDAYRNITYSGPTQPTALGVPLSEGLNITNIRDENENSEKAVYGELGYEFLEDTTLTVGYRHSKIKTGFMYIEASGLFDNFTGETALVGQQFDTEESVDTYKLSLEHEYSNDLFIYATAASGYRRSGFNLPTVVTPFSTYDSDTLWNYETGLKSTLLDGRLVANLALYYIDYTDIQLSIENPEAFVVETKNAGEASVKGIEFTSIYLVTDNFDISFSASLSDPQLEEDVPGGNSGKKGDKLPGSATETFSLGFNWYHSLTNNWEMFANGTYKYVGSRLNNFNEDLDIKLPSYDLVDIRAGLTSENLSVSLYVQNLFDEKVFYSLHREGPFFETVPTSRPRTVGVNVSYSF